KDAHDNATPSGNGMAATALLKLARLTGNNHWEEQAVRTLQSIGTVLESNPLAAGQSLIALDTLLGPRMECVLVAGHDESDEAMALTLQSTFLPRGIIVRRRNAPPQLTAVLFTDREPESRPQAFVCRDHSCHPPVHTADDLAQLLSQI
ncbi:MAG: hypothetical protein KDA58_09675, partial [Planctomycetaceae bacterium]|nr:hypothetical protein [Planctomycetaceae bacterium]